MNALMSIPSPDISLRTLFTIPVPWGSVPVRTYALCILLGIVIASIMTSRRLTKRGAEPGIVVDLAIWTVVLGLIGARIYHVLSHPNDYFGGQPFMNVFAIWEGGIAIYGALIGGLVGAFIACRITRIRLFSFLDALAPGLLIAQGIGRIGNYFNHELYGSPTNFFWGLEIETDNPAYPKGLLDGTLFHPTFLYELIWNLIGATLILWFGRKLQLQWGRQFAFYLIWYGAGRAMWESIRVDPSEMFAGIRTNVWASYVAVVIGLIIYLSQRYRHPAAEPSPYYDGHIWSAPDEAQVTFNQNDEIASTTAVESENTLNVSPNGQPV